MKRPAFTAGLSVLATFLVAAWLDDGVCILLGGALFCAFAVTKTVAVLRRYRAVSAVLLCCALAFFLHTAWTQLRWQPAQQWNGKTVQVQARVQEVFFSSGGRGVVLQVQDGDLPQGQRITVFAAPADRYDTVQATLAVSTSSAEGLDLQSSKAYGSYLFASVSDDWLVTGKDRPWYAFLSETGEWLTQQLRQHLPDESGSWLGAVSLGRRELLSESTEQQFRTAGLAHLLALSGLHLSVLTQLLHGVLRRLRLPKRVSSVLTVLLIWAFVGMVGPSASLVRAAFMVSFSFVAGLFFLKSDPLNSLGVSLLVLLLIDPYAAYDTGLLLSYGATLGILTLYPVWQRTVTARIVTQRGRAVQALCKVSRGACAALGLSLCAMIFTLPVTALFFGTVSPVTPLSNLLAVPVASAAVWLCFAALILMLIPGIRYIAPVLLIPAAWLAQVCIWVARQTASLPFAQFSITEWYWLLIPIVVLLVAVGWKRFGCKQ